MWSHGCSSLLMTMYHLKAQEKPFIPTKSGACMSMSWPLGNIAMLQWLSHTRANKRVLDTIIGDHQLRD